MSGVVVTQAERSRERFDDACRGDASWFTLLSSDITPTSGMSAGIMELAPHGGCLEPHRHAQAEIYFVAEGSGVVCIEGVETSIGAGAAVFIPGDALHSVCNESADGLKVFYVFPTDSFAEVVYRFPKTG